MSNVTEQELEAVSKAPRVTRMDLEDRILRAEYFTAMDGVVGNNPQRDRYGDDGVLSRLTFCVLIIDNGFTVVGKSAPASAENYDPKIGERIAYEDAVDNLWPLLGFELRTKLAQASK